MDIITRLLKYRSRKMLYGKEPVKIVLNWKHLLQIQDWTDRCDLKLDSFRTIIGYRILGMTIVDKGA